MGPREADRPLLQKDIGGGRTDRPAYVQLSSFVVILSSKETSMPTPAAPTINQIGGADSVVSSQPGDSVVTGTTDPGSTVVLAFNGSPLGSATVAADGAWSYALTAVD